MSGRRRQPVVIAAAPAPPLPVGVFRLWAAVLERGLTDWRESRTIESAAARLRVAELATWLGTARHAPGTFLWICDVLGLEPDAVRRAFARDRW